MLMDMIFPNNDSRNPYHNPNLKFQRTTHVLPSLSLKP